MVHIMPYLVKINVLRLIIWLDNTIQLGFVKNLVCVNSSLAQTIRLAI